jgi:transposase
MLNCSRSTSSKCSSPCCCPMTSSSWTIFLPTRSPAVRRAIDAAGAQLLFLPPYSPDLNPIEMVFSQMKAKLRYEAHRSVEALWNALASVADAITPTQCASYFRHCGYSQSA